MNIEIGDVLSYCNSMVFLKKDEHLDRKKHVCIVVGFDRGKGEITVYWINEEAQKHFATALYLSELSGSPNWKNYCTI
jgi:hypothetical protein